MQIVRAQLSGGNFPNWELSGGNCLEGGGAIVLGGNCLGELPRGQLSIGELSRSHIGKRLIK